MNSFRNICRWIHREFGFLAVGLTLVYAISGIAINHSHHWNASQVSSTESFVIETPGTGPTNEIQTLILDRLDLAEPVKSTWRASETEFQVFLEKEQYDVNLATGQVVKKGLKNRALLFDLNFMHLNLGKSPWTGIADVYGGVLILLALTGIFLVKGRRGLKGRGGLLMALGFLVPLVYAVLVRA
jgi:uncharacterized protein